MARIEDTPDPVVGLARDRVAGAIVFVIGLAILWQGWALPFGSFRAPGPGMLPMTLAAILATLGLLIAVRGGGPDVRALGWGEGRHVLFIFGALAFSALALEGLGYRLTVATVLLVLVGAVERKGWLPAILISAGVALGSYALFAGALKVPLPLGPFGF